MAGLVLELQRDALDKSVAVSDLLRKALVVARKLKVPDFERWVRWELDGYEGSDDIPVYRHIGGELKAFNPYNGWIPVMLDDRVMEMVTKRRIGQPLPELEATLAGKHSGQFHLSFAPSQQRVLMNHTGEDFQFALHISHGTLVGIVSGARNTVLSWALQLEEQGVIGEGMTFTETERKAAAALPHVVNYYGNVGQSQVMSHSPGSRQTIKNGGLDRDAVKQLMARIKKQQASLNLPEAEGAELSAEIATVEAQLTSPTPKPTIIADSLATIRRLLEGAAAGAAGNLLTELMRHLM